MPSDAYMLLSLANTKLRDYYCSPQDMCEDLGWDEEELASRLGAECVIVIGRKAVLYRRSNKKGIEHIRLE